MKSSNSQLVKSKKWIPAFAGMTRNTLIITAATIGSGVFALPYVVAQAGWLLTLIYFAALGTIIITVHTIYLKILAAEHEKERLLGLGRKYFGATGFWFGFIAIVIGLLISFVIFLILGTQFIQLLIPSLPHLTALFIFWIIIGIPVLIGNHRAASLATLSVLCVAAVILFVFLSSFTPNIDIVSRSIPTIDWHNLFLPFGVVLFTLAGWTGIEPFYESESRHESNAKTSAWPKLAFGTMMAATLYAMFTAGILQSAPHVTSDTISGLVSWPFWKRGLIAILGLFAITTVSMPISHEIRNALEKDLHWNKIAVRLIITLLPLAALLAGFNNFVLVVGLAGGVFVSMEYLLIIAIGQRALKLSRTQKFGLNLIAVVFLAAAFYEIVIFLQKLSLGTHF